jgi:hypothetical protein
MGLPPGHWWPAPAIVMSSTARPSAQVAIEVVIVFIAATLATIPNLFTALGAGQSWLAADYLIVMLLGPLILAAIGLPRAGSRRLSA